MMNLTRGLQLFALVGAAAILTGCGSPDAAAAGARSSATSVAATAEGASAPAGAVIEVKMITNGASNYFEPATVTASPGDVVRFVLDSGVHNVSFPPASNANAAGLPAASAFLAQPGQTFDVTVSMGAGEYTFQCDPHAALGMVGKLIVK